MEFRTPFGTIEIDEQEAAISVRISNLPSGWTAALTVRNGRLLDWGCTLEHVFLLVARGSDLRPIGFDLTQRKPFELLQSADDPRVWSRGEAADVEVAISEAPRRILLPPSADCPQPKEVGTEEKPEGGTARRHALQRLSDPKRPDGLHFDDPTDLRCSQSEVGVQERCARNRGRVIKVASGNDFLLLLTEAGGRLRSRHGIEGRVGPLADRAPFGTEIRVVDVACGGWHSLALTDEEDVYSWGWNDDGQCGLPAEEMRIVEIPHPIDLQGAAPDGTIETFGKK
ncbi:hypothetical protein M3Y99_00801500 [Aphelenchoides fujianensis]|nr:hypothetical protein M3Y99_00801500 [Aphelenchoides fujianensis]